MWRYYEISCARIAINDIIILCAIIYLNKIQGLAARRQPMELHKNLDHSSLVAMEVDSNSTNILGTKVMGYFIMMSCDSIARHNTITRINFFSCKYVCILIICIIYCCNQLPICCSWRLQWVQAFHTPTILKIYINLAIKLQQMILMHS